MPWRLPTYETLFGTALNHFIEAYRNIYPEPVQGAIAARSVCFDEAKL